MTQTWRKHRELDPQTHWRQGLSLGSLDNAIEGLIVIGHDKTARCKSYGEFELEIRQPDSEVRDRFGTFADMLHSFHPQSRPILWRMLVTQALIHKKIIECQSTSQADTRVGLAAISPNVPTRELDWRPSGSQILRDEALLVPQRVAQHYLRSRLPEVFGNIEQNLNLV